MVNSWLKELFETFFCSVSQSKAYLLSRVLRKRKSCYISSSFIQKGTLKIICYPGYKNIMPKCTLFLESLG
jgi:hypothetical protein